MDSQTQSAKTDPGPRQLAGTEAMPGTYKFDLLLPGSWNRPLWKRLFFDFRDRMFPEKFPPLHLTSRPVDVGMLVGDIVSLPWYRTVFTNIGNVITPETLPPLRLESRPIEVGELISDQMSHPWWTSLLRNLADRIAPEHLPPLQLTSTPVDSSLQSGMVQIVRWSSLITLPKLSLAERQSLANAPTKASAPRVVSAPPLAGMAGVPSSVPLVGGSAHVHGSRLKDALSRSRLREAFLITVAAAEAVYLLASSFGLI